MVNYTSQKQLFIFNFKTTVERQLDPTNRWVKLSQLLDWDALAGIYIQAMSNDMGRTGIGARIVIGALIIKHLKNLDDRGTIEEIQENPYLQYFIGLDGFTHDAVFDASLFVTIRKRLNGDSFDQMNQNIISKMLTMSDKKHRLSTLNEPILSRLKNFTSNKNRCASF